jgi:hemerythrin-like domain-containing protein
MQPKARIKRYQILDFFKGFVDRCHHGKEEHVLFPELKKKGLPSEGGSIGVMLVEHDAGRRYIREMSDDLERLRRGDGDAIRDIRENARGYQDLLQGNIQKENRVLFPMADRLLPDEEEVKIIEKKGKGI